MAESSENQAKIDEIAKILHEILHQKEEKGGREVGKDSGPSSNNSSISIVQNASYNTSRPLSACDRALSVLREIRSGNSDSVIKYEQRQCFAPYDRKGKGKKRSAREYDTPAKKRDDTNQSFAHRFVCLADKNQSKVPTPTEKSLLMSHGMGEKVLRFSRLDLSYKNIMDIVIDAYPKLANCGGCEFLKCLPNSRDLVTIPLQICAGASPILLQLQNKAGYSRIYIRPIQCDLSWDDDLDQLQSDL